MDFEFDLLMKKTNQDSINNTVLGRDNADYEQFSKRWIKQKKLSVRVLKNDLLLVGDLSFKIKKDEASVSAYEPYHFEIKIEGEGNLDKLKSLDLNISNAKVFSSKPVHNYKLTKNGYKGSWTQKFAIVASENFTFPSISYKYFDPYTKKPKEYKLKSFDVEVKKFYEKEELLDKDDTQNYSFQIRISILCFSFCTWIFTWKNKVQKTKVKV